MDIIDKDPLKIKYQLNWFKTHLSEFNESELLLINPIVKRIIFLKVGADTSQRFMNSVIYDALCCINEIHQNKKRQFYFSYRSLIENLARACLSKENDDKTGILKLVSEFQNALKLKSTKKDASTGDDVKIYKQDIYSDLMNGYSQACGYVHNNQSAGIDVMQSYTQIINNKPLSNQERKELLKKLLALLESCTRALSLLKKEAILRNFGRNFYFIEELLPESIASVYLQ